MTCALYGIFLYFLRILAWYINWSREIIKINCIKFIILNLVSFFAEGSKLNEKLLGLPIYLIKDLENFLKLRDINKFLWLDMDYFIL